MTVKLRLIIHKESSAGLFSLNWRVELYVYPHVSANSLQWKFNACFVTLQYGFYVQRVLVCH